MNLALQPEAKRQGVIHAQTPIDGATGEASTRWPGLGGEVGEVQIHLFLIYPKKTAEPKLYIFFFKAGEFKMLRNSRTVHEYLP